MILLKLAAHSLITLGAALIVWLLTQIDGDQLLVTWAIFTAAALLADSLLLSSPSPAPPTPTSVLSFFTEIDHDPDHINQDHKPDFSRLPAGWVSGQPHRHDHSH